MCGIAGVVSLGDRPVDAPAVKRMCDALAHRGPDDAGYAFFRPGEPPLARHSAWCSFCDARFAALHEHLPAFGSAYAHRELQGGAFALALGHRRLSILDTRPEGHQPMFSSDRRFAVVHNGEVYNFRELRQKLESRGYPFRTRTDTEVILHLWAEYGEGALSMLDGMFAFAIYDRLDNTLTLARDRFGVKPLYWATSEGGAFLLFASEPKAILASGLVKPAFDPAVVVEYFTFQNLFGRHTLWQGTEILAPGETLTVRPGERAAPRRRRWHAGFPAMDPALAADEPAARRAVTEAFEAAVTRQLVSDVPVGSFLSGGMDSGSIVAVAGRTIPRLHTFTGGFDLTNVNGIEQGFDERRLAEELSYRLQTEHYAVVLHAGDMPAVMERLTWHMDDPRVGMCHQNWYVAKLASRFVKVCLAGTGGDELFAGYPWRYAHASSCDSVEEFDRRTFAAWHRLRPPQELPGLFAPDVRTHQPGTWDRFAEVCSEAPPEPAEVPLRDRLLQRALHFEFNTFLHGLLVTEDRISMAHSMETRVPFLDNALADLAWRIPPSLKLRSETSGAGGGAGAGGADGKRILRRAMERYLPASFLNQTKQGFSPPDANWYRGPSMDYIKSVLWDRRARERPWFDQDYVDGVLAEHFEGRRNNRLVIWSLLSFECLQRHWEERPASSPRDARRPVEVIVP